MSKQTKLDLALLLDECCHDFSIGFSANEALLFASQTRDYNECTSQVMFGLVERINSLIPPMKYPGENINNGKPFHTFHIGQVPGGRILRVEFDKLHLDGHGYSWGDCMALSDQIAKLKDEFKAGNVVQGSRVPGMTQHISFWWD